MGYEIGFYWVKIAHFLSWEIAFYDEKGWSICGDQNFYSSVDFNVINPNRIEPPND